MQCQAPPLLCPDHNRAEYALENRHFDVRDMRARHSDASHSYRDRPPPVHARGRLWVPACAGTTNRVERRTLIFATRDYAGVDDRLVFLVQSIGNGDAELLVGLVVFVRIPVGEVGRRYCRHKSLLNQFEGGVSFKFLIVSG